MTGRRLEGKRACVWKKTREGGKSGFGKQIEGRRAWKGARRMIRQPGRTGGRKEIKSGRMGNEWENERGLR